MYGEDADLAARARKAGYHPAITPDAVIVHHVAPRRSRSRSAR